jgi:protein CpxP
MEKHVTHNTRSIARPSSGLRGSRWILATAAVVSALSMVSVSHAAEGTPPPPNAERHHGKGRHHGPMTPEQAEKRLEGKINRMVPDATPEQKAKLSAIAKAAMTDLRPLREKRHAARQEAMKLLAQPTIDRNALERARVGEQQIADQASRRMTQALADAAEVLTPAQRAKVAEHLGKRKGPMR